MKKSDFSRDFPPKKLPPKIYWKKVAFIGFWRFWHPLRAAKDAVDRRWYENSRDAVKKLS